MKLGKFTDKSGSLKWRTSWICPDTGKRKFKQFKTKEAGNKWIDQQKDKKLNHGKDIAKADTRQLATWIELDKKLRDLGHTLVEAGEAMSKVWTVKGKESVTLTLDAYLKERQKAGLQASTLNSTKGKVNRILSAHSSLNVLEMPVREISPLIIRQCLEERSKKISIQGLEYERQRLRDFFSWCHSHQLVHESPVPGKSRDQKRKEQKRQKDVEILSPVEARELLRDTYALQHPGLMAWVVLGLFCGLRPDSSFRVYETLEGGNRTLRTLDWEVLRKSLKSGRLEVTDKVGHRSQSLCNEGHEWITWLIKEYGIKNGPVVGSNWAKTLVAFRKGWRDKYDREKWPTDLLRHSFGTYRMHRAKTVASLADEMGNSPTIIERHYFKRGVDPAHVDDYWALSPSIFESEDVIDISKYDLPGDWHENIPVTRRA